MENFLGVGFVFRPTDNELVRSYLLNKVTGKPLPCNSAVGICDLYGTMEPWEIWERFGRPGMNPDEEYLYFFTNLKKLKKGGEGPRICRKIGPSGGSWNVETVEKVLLVDGVRCGIRRFRYENKNAQAQHGRWLMKEYCLCEFKDSYVLCRLKKKTTKGSKAEGNSSYHLRDHGDQMIGTRSQDLCQHVSTTTLFDRNHMYESEPIPVGTVQNLPQNAPATINSMQIMPPLVGGGTYFFDTDLFQFERATRGYAEFEGETLTVPELPAMGVPEAFDDHQMIGTGSEDLYQHVSATTLFDQNHMYQSALISVGTAHNLQQNVHATINSMQIMSPLVGGGANSCSSNLFQFELEDETLTVPEISAVGVPETPDDHEMGAVVKNSGGHSDLQNQVHVGDSIQMAASRDSDPRKKKKRKNAELEGETAQYLLSDVPSGQTSVFDKSSSRAIQFPAVQGWQRMPAAMQMATDLSQLPNNEMTADSLDVPYLEPEHHMRSVVEDNGRNSSIYNEFVNFQNKISSMTDDDLFGSLPDLVYIEP